MKADDFLLPAKRVCSPTKEIAISSSSHGEGADLFAMGQCFFCEVIQVFGASFFSVIFWLTPGSLTINLKEHFECSCFSSSCWKMQGWTGFVLPDFLNCLVICALFFLCCARLKCTWTATFFAVLRCLPIYSF